MRPTLICILILASGTAASSAPPKVDWLFPAGAGRGSQVTVQLSDAAGAVRVWIDQTPGVTAEPAKENGKITVKVAADAEPGVRWLRFHNDEGASVLRPFVIGTLTEVEEKEPNNAEAQLVTCPVIVNGRLDKSGDVDAFRMSLKRGQTLVASMLANETLGSPMDGVLQVCDAAGFVLAQNDETHGLDPQIVFTVPRDGDYVVRTFAFPATPDSSINFAGKIDFIYRLTLTIGGFIDHALPMALKAGQANAVTLVGWNLPAEAARVTITPAKDRAAVTLFHPALANAITLPVREGANLIAAGVREAEAQAVDRIAKVALPAVITGLPAAITGRLSERSSDSFRFPARKGESLRLRVESQSLGFPLDAVLRVTDAAGKQLAESDDGERDKRDARDPALTFKPTADGDCVVSVRDLHGRGGFRFVYRLSIEAMPPDFAVALDKDSYVATAGKAEITVTIDRQNGFDGDINVRVEGLPPGAAATPVASQAKDASAKSVKLNVTIPASAAPGARADWAGPIRIIADSGATRRVATFPTIANARHEEAWLTVGKEAK